MMADTDLLSALPLYDSSSDSDASPSSGSTTTPLSRQQKLSQTESQFQEQKRSWIPQDDVHLSHTRLTLSPSSPSLSLEMLKTKAEQEYYMRRYSDALLSAGEALKRIDAIVNRDADGNGGGSGDRGGNGGGDGNRNGNGVREGKLMEVEKRELWELVRSCERKIGGRV